MINIRIIILFISFFCLVSCGGNSIEEIGGIQVQLKYGNEVNNSIEKDLSTLVSRFEYLNGSGYQIEKIIEKDLVTINLPGIKDITSVNRLLDWDKSMKLTYAVGPSYYTSIREYLSEDLETPLKNKPYKGSSIIGLVDSKKKLKVEKIVESSEFSTMFPDAGLHYWGAERMEGKEVLFIESKSSPYIDQTMFSTVDPRQSKDQKEGYLALELSEGYKERIGQITGNDSTYLLHVFHHENYISKIIKPHITEPSFIISGAFTPKDALVLGVLWNTDDLENRFEIEDIILMGGE